MPAVLGARRVGKAAAATAEGARAVVAEALLLVGRAGARGAPWVEATLEAAAARVAAETATVAAARAAAAWAAVETATAAAVWAAVETVYALGFRVYALGFRVYALGFRQ